MFLYNYILYKLDRDVLTGVFNRVAQDVDIVHDPKDRGRQQLWRVDPGRHLSRGSKRRERGGGLLRPDLEVLHFSRQDRLQGGKVPTRRGLQACGRRARRERIPQSVARNVRGSQSLLLAARHRHQEPRQDQETEVV